MVLALVCEQVHAAHALSVSCGQRHTPELNAATSIARIPDPTRYVDEQRQPNCCRYLPRHAAIPGNTI